MLSRNPLNNPLAVEEVIKVLRNRWGVTYDLRILKKDKRLYFQIMWGFLEKQSFPLTEKEYRENLAEVLDVVNRLGKSSNVRNWLLKIEGKPRLGKALSLPLMGDERLEEFLL